MSSVVPSGYDELLRELKARIRSTQIKAMAAANRELILVYWEIGRSIVLRQEQAQWGKSVIERLARDLHNAFPEMSGFSSRNLWRMRSFYLAWRSVGEVLPQAVAELSWGHNALRLEKLKSPEVRLWYAEQARGHGWSRPILGMQIDSRLHLRVGQFVTNFPQTLPHLARTWPGSPVWGGLLNLLDGHPGSSTSSPARCAIAAIPPEYWPDCGRGTFTPSPTPRWGGCPRELAAPARYEGDLW